MKCERIVESFLDRALPYLTVGKKILTDLDLDTDGFKHEVAKKLIQSLGASSGHKKLLQLNSALKDQVLVSDKVIRFYQVKPELAKQAVDKAYKSLITEICPANEFFPCSLTQEELQKAPEHYQFIHMEKINSALYLYYSIKVEATIRERFDSSTFSSLPETLRTQYSEVFGEKTQTLQYINVVRIDPQTGFVQFRIDHATKSHHDVVQNLIYKLVLFVENQIFKPMGSQLTLSESTRCNLFPVIRKLYMEEKEAPVLELGFTTSSDSVKKATQRKNSRDIKDLRKDTFQIGGIQAVADNISPFFIAIRYVPNYQNGLTGSVDVELPGTFRIANQIPPVLNGAFVTHALNETDFLHVTSRMLHYYSNHQ